uniref:FMRFamide-6 n=1 Tax=Sarcophaga bullata TaxID=7385 RepID=FAR6_SARBU|nr:RecName: Full=FMRFamide-6; AltName: Full=SabFMRFamide-6 [Sarcophaga bullata]
TPTHDFMRF